MLWKVENSNLWILGSVHALDEPILSIGEIGDLVLSRSIRVLFEADLTQRPDVLGVYPPWESLARNLQPESFGLVAALWRRLGIEAPLDRFEPWQARMQIAVRLIGESGLRFEYGVDRFIRGRLDPAVTIGYLEHVNDGPQAFRSAPLDEQISGLLELVRAPAKVTAEWKLMIKAWRENQVAPLLRVVQQRMTETPVTHARVILERNRRWIPSLVALAKDGFPTLAVVGIFHMLGRDGLPALLEPLGWRVTPEDF